jgi:6-pyruvoyltetrahydropterin/6-carboxytetrahydropterin synthase
MHRLTVRRRFSAAHNLRGHPGKCAQLHGHNYNAEITVQGDKLDQAGMVMDFSELKAICDDVLDKFDHTYLNELPEFAQVNVTAENLAVLIFQTVKDALSDPAVSVFEVKLYETEDSAVIYREK